MCAFLCAINESVWDAIEIGWVRPEKPKAEWDKAIVDLANANIKAIKAIFYDVSTNKFQRISQVKTT